MRQLAQRLSRSWCLVLLGLLVGQAHLSPVVAGQLDALIASTPSLGDSGFFDDLQYPDKILTVVRESSGETGPVSLGLLTGGPVTGELELGLINALGPSPEELPGEFADRAGNPTVMEGIWTLKLDSKDELERVRLAAADAAGPGLYNDHDWFESAALVVIGGGAGAALVFLGFSQFRVRRRHRSGPSQSHRPHYNFHRSRRRALRGR